MRSSCFKLTLKFHSPKKSSSTQPLNQKYVHSSTHPLIHSSTHPFIHSSIHPLINSSTHPFIHSSIHPLINSSTHQFIHSSIHPLIHSSTHPGIIEMSKTKLMKTLRSTWKNLIGRRNFHGTFMEFPVGGF